MRLAMSLAHQVTYRLLGQTLGGTYRLDARLGAGAMGTVYRAHHLLLDVFNVIAPTPEQIRLTALAASAAGDTADAYYYMSEYHISGGDLMLATQQLELALASSRISNVQRQRFRARLE